MSHKYLENILPKGKTPYDFYYDDEIRNQKWEKEREQFSFDEREMWLLDFTFFCWLYEHLKRYEEVNHTDLIHKIIKINDKEKSLEEWVNLMISNSKDLILANIYSEENVKLAEFTIEIFKKTIFYL